MEFVDEEKKEEGVKYQFDIQQVIALLNDILSGNNARIKEATKYLK